MPARRNPPSAPGMEVAAYLTEKAHSVSVVEVEETPFRRFLGERVGHALMKVSAPGTHRAGPACPVPPVQLSPLRPPPHPHWQMFENNRVKFYMQTEVSELRAQEGKVGPPPLPPSRPLCPLSCAPELLTRPATLRS